MSRYLLPLLFLASFPVAAQTPDPISNDEVSTFPAGVEQVIVDAVVTDERGLPVPGLVTADFKVSEGGEAQTITSFEAIEVEESFDAPEPSRISSNTTETNDATRSFVIVFDDLNTSPRGALRAKKQLEKFFTTIFRPGDLVTLIPIAGGGAWSVRMPTGRDDLLRVLGRFRGRRIVERSPDGISDYEAMMIHRYRDEEVTALVERRLSQAGLVAGGLGEDRTPVQVIGIAGRAGDVYQQARERNGATLTMLSRILRSLAPVRGRKSVILVSEGFIHDTQQQEFRWVAEASWAANAVVYFLNLRGVESMPTLIEADRTGPIANASFEEEAAQVRDISRSRQYGTYEADGANSLALDSGGFTVKTNDLSKGLWRIVRESRTYYLLGYEPTNSRRDGSFRRIQVDVARPGVEVRARKGYYGPSDTPTQDSRSEQLDQVVGEGLVSPYQHEAIPMRVTDYALGETNEGLVRVLLAAEVDPAALAFDERAGRFVSSLASHIRLSSRDAEEVYSHERTIDLDLSPQVRARMTQTWIPVSGSFELPAGTYQAQVLVQEAKSGRIGTVRHEFPVPEVGPFRISTPILTDTFMGHPSEAGGAPFPVPLARRRFVSGVEIACIFDVFGAARDKETNAARVALSYGIRRVDGPPAKLHTRAVEPGEDGRLSQRIKVPLRGAPPGAYEIVLSLFDELSGQTVEQREAFEVDLPASSELPALLQPGR